MDIIVYAGIFVVIVLLVVLIVKQSSLKKDVVRNELNASNLERAVKNAEDNMNREIKAVRAETVTEVRKNFEVFARMISDNQRGSAEAQDKRLAELAVKFNDMNIQNEQRLEQIRTTMETRIKTLTDENNKHIEEIRRTVDEKLQKTLEDRISQSFKMVSERLEQVYKGLGEMQTLASGVGDLKKVLANVKTRGILGEIQLGAILEQILSPEQYEENVAIKQGRERVEFAVKLPGDETGPVYLPIDAKFPADCYTKLLDAYDSANREAIKAAEGHLIRTIKNEAKNIRDKYICPPRSTDFAIMFLPVEGLYAEVVRLGLVEILQREYKVNIAGPTTMAALLNSLQMGFKTLAIQKHSSEVWNILGAVKTEFGKFEQILEATQRRITQANAELDKLVGVRTRSIQRKLQGVQELSEPEAHSILELDDIVTAVSADDEE